MADAIEKPKLWIVAGPNGSGKSTLYGRTDIEDFGRSVWIINPDILTAQIAQRENLSFKQSNVETLNRIAKWLRASIKAYRTIGVETVLSTPKYRALVRQAKKLGFEIRVLYVTLQTADMNIERVRARVREGGHGVPTNKIRSRRKRSFEQLPWFLDKADVALIFDNSGKTPELVGKKEKGTITISPDVPAEMLEAILNYF